MLTGISVSLFEDKLSFRSWGKLRDSRGILVKMLFCNSIVCNSLHCATDMGTVANLLLDKKSSFRSTSSPIESVTFSSSLRLKFKYFN